MSPKLAQALALHSDINLTMNTYTSVELDEQATAMEHLPSIGPGSSRGGRKHTIEPKSDAGPASALVPELVPTIDSGCLDVTSGDTEPQEQAANGEEPKSP